MVDKLEFFGGRVYAVDIAEDVAASGATLRVEVAASVSRLGRDRRRFIVALTCYC